MDTKLESLEWVVRRYTQGLECSKSRVLALFSNHYPAIQAQADHLESLVGCQAPARILDLACGSGLVTIELALRGYQAIGLDCTPAMLELAHTLAVQKGANVSWVLGDMRTIRDENEMDFVFLRDVVFGMFGSRKEHELTVRNIARALKPGGRMLLEVYNRTFAVTHGIETCLHYDPATDRFIENKPKEEPTESIGPPSNDELEGMLARNSLKVIKRDGWKWPEDPDPPPWRADIIVAEKI